MSFGSLLATGALADFMGFTGHAISVPSLPESPWLFITLGISALDAMLVDCVS